MLTLESIIAATRNMTAHGEGMHPPVPRDHGARPRTSDMPLPAQRDEDADPADRDA